MPRREGGGVSGAAALNRKRTRQVGQNMPAARLPLPEGREFGTSDFPRFESENSRWQSRRRQRGADKLILLAWWKRRANGSPFKKVAPLINCLRPYRY